MENFRGDEKNTRLATKVNFEILRWIDKASNYTFCFLTKKYKKWKEVENAILSRYRLPWKRTNFPFNVVRTRAPKTNFRIKGPLLDPPKFFQGFIQARQSDSRSVPSAVLLIAPVFVGFTFAVIARRYVHFGPIFTDRAQQGWWADIIPAIRFLNFGRGNEGE